MEYKKQPLPAKQLVEVLKRRGLVVADDAAAETFLENVLFYRLKGYLLHFERKIAVNPDHRVPPATTFERILEIYELDRKLRLLFFEAIEKIEISFRSNFTNVYALGHKDAHWFLEPAHFVDDIQRGQSYQHRLIGRIRRDIGLDQIAGDGREQEAFIQHYLAKYTKPELPAAWMLAESLSLGVWSMMYQKLSNTGGQKAVAKKFVVPHLVLGSWMHALSITRNFCAHHARLWNRVFVFKPAVLPGYESHFAIPSRLYAQAFAAAYLLRRIDPKADWHLRFKTVALTCPAAEVSELGALPNWDRDPFWSNQELPEVSPKAISPAMKVTI